MSTRYGDRGFDRYEDEDRYGERESEREEGRGYGERAPRRARERYEETGREPARDYGTDYERGYPARGYRARAYGSRYGREGSYAGPSGREYDYGGGYARERERDHTSEYVRAAREEEPVHSYETDYGRTTSRFYGRSGYDYGREDYDERPNYGSARSDYGRHAYGGRIDERGMERESGFRNWWDRAADEVLSWFGGEGTEKRRHVYDSRDARAHGAGKFRGRGPKNYRRSDERIQDEINDRLTENEWLDASDVDVSVNSGVVILSGAVDSRYARRLAEEIADSVSGVVNVQNNLRVENDQALVTTGTTGTTTEATALNETTPGDASEVNRASKAVGRS
ncbi:MAG TPA: BON domain-containing protein [Pyrinomonadaceae bacterium]|nr:BON domain-containing protein [Pyrinomonadaceae bacterium]